MAAIEIREVSDKKTLSAFTKLPLSLYRNEPYYVPHLLVDRKKIFDKSGNPFFHHARAKYYLAYKDGHIAGRIAGIVNDLHNEFHNEQTGFFGFFDCINDFETAASLLRTAGDFTRKEGMGILRGPANFSTNDEVGLLIEGFDSLPCFMMTYNPPYYLDMYDRLGLKKAEDLIAYYIDDKNPPPERIMRIAEKIRQRSRVRIRKIDMKHFDSELELIRTIYNSAWSRNWGFIPMTEEEFEHTADDFKKIIDPELVFLAFIDDEPAGFQLAVPDYNPVLRTMNGRLFPAGFLKFIYYTKVRRIITGLRVITMGIVHKYQKIGLDLIFFADIYNEGRRRGYKWAEMSWILERNTLMNKSALDMGARPYKKYRIYEKSL